jgi:hypothetical protein
LYFARPFAVNPAPLDAGSFSPFLTDKLTLFLVAINDPSTAPGSSQEPRKRVDVLQ